MVIAKFHLMKYIFQNEMQLVCEKR